MINTLFQFFYMNGYGGYIFSAYIITIVLLLVQWFIPWRRWKKYLNEQNS